MREREYVRVDSASILIVNLSQTVERNDDDDEERPHLLHLVLPRRTPIHLLQHPPQDPLVPGAYPTKSYKYWFTNI
jgi:hypothetical protein